MRNNFKKIKEKSFKLKIESFVEINDKGELF